MQNDNQIISKYFNSIPELNKSQIGNIIKNFEQTKDNTLYKIASTKKCLKQLFQIYNNILKNDLQISTMVCDIHKSNATTPNTDYQDEVDGSAPANAHISITMKCAREMLSAQINDLIKEEDINKRHEMIYRLKLKSDIIIKILNNCKLPKIATEYTKARNDLATTNLRLVIYVVKPLYNKGIEFSDLIQEGNIGLMTAIDKYDYPPHFSPSQKPTKFTTMAVNWIWLYASRSVSNDSRTVRVPVYINNHTNKMHRAIRKLAGELHREPTKDELATELKYSLQKLDRLCESAQRVTYIINDNSQQFNEDADNGSSFIDTIPSESPDDMPMDDQIIRKMDMDSLRTKIEQSLSQLPPRQEKAIRLRYAIYTNPDFDPKDEIKGQELVDELEVSQTRCLQLLNKGKKKFKTNLGFKTFCEYTDQNHPQDEAQNKPFSGPLFTSTHD